MKQTLWRNADLHTAWCWLLMALLLAQPTYPEVVISQVYGGGGATTGSPSFRNDYIELFNRGIATVDLVGFSVQYAPATGSNWTATLLSGSIAPGQYYLIQEAGGSLGSVLPAPDAIGTVAMSATNGKLALVSDVTALTGACPISFSIVDMLGYGNASCFEGLGTVAPLSTTLAALRLDDGCTDTGNNSADFASGIPAPRSTGSPTHPCSPVPIRLSYFTGHVNPITLTVDLRWGTLSEINNYGFELQKKVESENTYQTIPRSFVAGHGTTLVPHDYAFSDSGTTSGNWLYRLQQIDLDGTTHPSEPIIINLITAVGEGLARRELVPLRNYPNPFNPITTIEFSLAAGGWVNLKVFDTLGREVAVLADNELPAGDHQVEWNASGLAGGAYVCRLQSSGTVRATRVVLLK